MGKTRFKPGDVVMIIDGSRDVFANHTTSWMNMFDKLVGKTDIVTVAELRSEGERFERELYQTSGSGGFWLHGNWVVSAPDSQQNEELNSFFAEFS